jgi:hypothetical protein
VSSTTIHDSFARGVIVNTPADQSDAYLSYVNVFPYAGSSGGTLCGGAPYPYVSPPNPNPACPSGSNTITSINSECPYSISGTVFDATTLELCPVRIQPWSP